MAAPTPSRRATDRAALRRGRFLGGQLVPVTVTMFLVALGALVGWRLFGVSSSSDGTPSWSPDGRRIVFTSLRNGQADVFVMNVDGTAREAITETQSDEGAPAFAPDGQRVAFDSDRDGNFEIYIMAANGGDVRRVTQHPGRDLSPSWSHDGKRIAFLSDRDSPQGLDVYTMNTDGSGVERITPGGNARGVPQFSPDDRWLAVTVGDEVQIFENTTRTLHRLMFTPENGSDPTWSADSRELAFSRTTNGGIDLFTMRADGTDQKRLVSMPAGNVRDQRWSPNGAEMLFALSPGRTGDRTRPRPVKGGAIYLLELSTGKLTRLSR